MNPLVVPFKKNENANYCPYVAGLFWFGGTRATFGFSSGEFLRSAAAPPAGAESGRSLPERLMRSSNMPMSLSLSCWHETKINKIR